ncbi:hypothetical protein [Clostridioides sp. ZZV14-6153]|uniref:hypothetical protein n=2 Tax=unclassified Clostridioides TaxID=2635829 RepID=UPI001D10C810
MTFKELVNKVRNLVLEAKKVTIEDTENNFTSDNVEGALKECIDRADSAFQEADSGKTILSTAIGSPATSEQTFQEYANYIVGFKGTINSLQESLRGSMKLYSGTANVISSSSSKIFNTYGNATVVQCSYISISNITYNPTIFIAYSSIESGNSSTRWTNSTAIYYSGNFFCSSINTALGALENPWLWSLSEFKNGNTITCPIIGVKSGKVNWIALAYN